MTHFDYYQGHKISYAHGYQEIYLPEHPRARASGSVYVHDLVAEQIVGRTLLSNEVVHHIDEDKSNNSIENLMVFDSYGSHNAYHCISRCKFTTDFTLYRHNGVYHCESDVSVILGKCVYAGKSQVTPKGETRVRLQKMKICPSCGGMMTQHANLCHNCRAMQQRKVVRPCKQQLKADLQYIHSFVGVGKKYGVSDAAVRKWCKLYGIPFKTSEIKRLTPHDWKIL